MRLALRARLYAKLEHPGDPVNVDPPTGATLQARALPLTQEPDPGGPLQLGRVDLALSVGQPQVPPPRRLGTGKCPRNVLPFPLPERPLQDRLQRVHSDPPPADTR